MDSDLGTGLVSGPVTSAAGPWVVALAALLVAAVGLVTMLRGRSRSRGALEQVLAQTERLQRELDELRRAVAGPGQPAARPGPGAAGEAGVPYVITDAGTATPTATPTATDHAGAAQPAVTRPAVTRPAVTRPATADGRIGGRLFADLVLRESVVRTGTLAHGVRRALDPRTRQRIRFEMGREVKRSRKQRRADVRDARRRLHAEQRAEQRAERGAA